MNVSGILVVVPASRMDPAIEGLAALPGVDVHHVDAATGRIIVTQEAESIDAEIEGLQRIKALPGVILAEMVLHCFEDDPEIRVLAQRSDAIDDGPDTRFEGRDVAMEESRGERETS